SSHEDIAFGAFPDLLDKPLVDFELIEPQFIQLGETRISSAKIVNNDSNPCITQGPNGVTCRFKIRNNRAFGNFSLKAIGRQPGIGEDRQDILRKILGAELRRRKIERQGNILWPVRRIAARIAK